MASHENEERFSMWVAIHNPSSTPDVSVVRIAVPNGDYSAMSFNSKTQVMENADSNLICFMDTLPDDSAIESCFLSVNKTTYSNDATLIQITKNKSEVKSIPQNLNIGNSIENKDVKITFAGFSTADSMIQL